jgi:hypothetical protein
MFRLGTNDRQFFCLSDSYRFSDDELILECRVRCHPPPRITWLKDGVPLQGSSRHQQSELADGVCRLTISSPDATSDSGQYTCLAENNVWSEQISSTVQFAGKEGFSVHNTGEVPNTAVATWAGSQFLCKPSTAVAIQARSHSCADQAYTGHTSGQSVLWRYQALQWSYRRWVTLVQVRALQWPF